MRFKNSSRCLFPWIVNFCRNISPRMTSRLAGRAAKHLLFFRNVALSNLPRLHGAERKVLPKYVGDEECFSRGVIDSPRRTKGKISTRDSNSDANACHLSRCFLGWRCIRATRSAKVSLLSRSRNLSTRRGNAKGVSRSGVRCTISLSPIRSTAERIRSDSSCCQELRGELVPEVVDDVVNTSKNRLSSP